MKKVKMVLIIILQFFSVSAVMFSSYFVLKEFLKVGEVSDIFEIINVLFTGLAFTAAGTAVYFQSCELKETKNGLIESELMQKKMLDTQAKMLENQRLQAVASIKLKKLEITAILKNSEYNYGISPDISNEMEELIELINHNSKPVDCA